MALLYWLPMTDETLKNKGLSDVQPTNHGATVNNSGKLGKCYDFAGTTSQYIDTGFKESFGTGDFTITAWFKLTDSGSRTYQPIISNKATGATSVGVAIYYHHSQQKFLWSTADGTSATEIWMANTFSYSSNLNTWHHIAMVRNSSDSKIGYFYIDGVRYELASVPPIRNVTNNTNNMFIGSVIVPTTNYMWTGSLCDIRIYDKALSHREVKEISKGLVLHYPLDHDGVGGDNLLTNSSFSKNLTGWTASGTNNGIVLQDGYRCLHIPGALKATRYIKQNITSAVSGESTDQLYTISADIRVDNIVRGTTNPMCEFYFGGTYDNNGTSAWLGATYISGTKEFYDLSNTGWHRLYVVVRFAHVPTNMGAYIYIRDITGDVYIKNIKFEFGDTATPWCPNSADTQYVELGLNLDVVHDVSGYKNNGELYTTDGTGSFIIETNSPRYLVATRVHSLNPTSSAKAGTAYIRGDCGLTTPNQLTIAFWCYMRVGYGGQTGQGVFCTSNSTIGSDNIGGDYQTSAMNHRDNTIDINSSDGNSHLRPSITFIANEWHHYAFTYDGQNAKTYRNGVLQDTKSFSAATALGTFNMVVLGLSRAGGVWRRNDNTYSDLRVYATALSAEDVAELYHTPITLSNNGTLMTQGEYVEV